MKIALFDPYLDKFTDGMIKWWREHGYEVEAQRYYNPELAERADVIWFETVDNNLASATKPGSAILDDKANHFPWDLHDMDLSNKQVIVRAIDIEVWQGHQSAALWDVVDDLIFIAPHIREVAGVDALPGRRDDLRVHTIPHCVDLDKWTFKEREPGFNVAIVSERWISKGTDLVLQVCLKLQQKDNRYKFFWLGQRSGESWDLCYFDDFIEHNKLNMEVTNILQDGMTVDQFLEDKNYLLHGSHKEAFSAATAEAMAKGIKPVLHRFYGADAIWPGMTWSSVDDAVDMISHPADNRQYNSEAYRKYLVDHGYTLPQMMERIDKIINSKE